MTKARLIEVDNSDRFFFEGKDCARVHFSLVDKLRSGEWVLARVDEISVYAKGRPPFDVQREVKRNALARADAYESDYVDIGGSRSSSTNDSDRYIANFYVERNKTE